jgi:effector-binding domain-containing protein
MEANKLGIRYTIHPPQLVASIRTNVENRKEILTNLKKLIEKIPAKSISGDPFCIFYYVTSISKGTDVEYGVPVHSEFPIDGVSFRTLPKMESFTIQHKGKLEDIGKSYGIVYKYAYKYGFPSQEFSREAYPHLDKNREELEINVEFIIHPWNRLLVENMNRVLGTKQQENILEGLQTIEIETPLEVKFEWLIKALKKLEKHTNKSRQYEIISECAHFFPEEMILELRKVYLDAKMNSKTVIEAVDKTLEYMKSHTGWGSIPIREGNVLYTTKSPCNPKAFAEAKTKLERIKAYCFCPIIRPFLDREVPEMYCNCGAGWPKQLWEGVFGEQLKVEIVKSLTKGDAECQFAIPIPQY